MTRFHREPQPPEGQGFRRSNSIGGITKLTRRRLRRQQRRSNPYSAVFTSALRNLPVSSIRGHCLPSSEGPRALSETPRGVEDSNRVKYDIHDFFSDDRLNLSWAVTDVSTPQGRKLIIKRCDALDHRKKYPNENAPLVMRNLKNGRRRKRLVSMRQNYSDKISSSDESVEESVVESVEDCVVESVEDCVVESVEDCALRKPCHGSAPLTPFSSKDENRFNQDSFLAKNDVKGGGIITRERDVTLNEGRRLRRENTLILDHDESMDGVRRGQTVPNSVTNPVINPVTHLEYDSLILDHGTAEHQNNDMLETSSERFSYKTLLRPVEHFRCVFCDTNLETLTLGTVGESLDIMDVSRFHIDDGRSEITLFCPECGFSPIGYR